MPILLIATGNAHKALEIEAILRAGAPDEDWKLETAADHPALAEPAETGETFVANALEKARYYAARTGRLALADDSGLVVDALGGRPGVRSARYAPTSPERNARLLVELARAASSRRTARFVCVAALADPAGRAVTREGRAEGRIAAEPRGAGGFGYDPIFVPAGQAGEPERTLAQYTGEEKNAISHRGRAIRAIAPAALRALLEGRVAEAGP